MTFLRKKVEKVMMHGEPGDPDFSSFFEFLLYAASRMYRWAVRSRALLYRRGILKSRKLPCKVVSIGNITVGGTGKTPMVHYVANLLKGLNQEVSVISRGYGGSAQRSGGIVSDGTTRFMNVRQSGDEPLLLSLKLKRIPLLVGKDRYRAARLAIKRFGPSVVILDDGFQHLSLKRDLDLLLLDSIRPVGNGHCLPRGVLREPADQMKRASALILTRWREEDASADLWRDHFAGTLPVFRCNHVPDGLYMADGRESLDLNYLMGKRLFLFSGIVRNDSFRDAVRRLRGKVVGWSEFGDHHRYTDRELQMIWEKANRLHADYVMTTEKDYVNLSDGIPLRPGLLVLGISISFGEDREAFEAYLKKAVSSSLETP